MEFNSKILKVIKCGDNENNFQVIQFEKPKDFSFTSGQFIMVGCNDFKLKSNPEMLKWSSFSVASAPFQDYFELCIRIQNTDGLTNHLGKKQAGDEIIVKGPFGHFMLNNEFKEIAFIALGTGIAPLISMIRTLLHENDKRQITLFYGFRNGECFLYEKELTELTEKHKNFRLYFVASNPEENWEGEKGFVQNLIKKTDFSNPKNEIHFYLCGIPKAIESINEFLIEQGFNKEKIFFEKW